MNTTIICIAGALIAGLLMSRVTKKLNMPAVTGYLISGLLIGPFFLGAIGIEGFGFSSLESVENLKVVTQVALGFIAFSMGNEFRLSQLKAMGSKAITIGIFQAVGTTILVDATLITVHMLFPSMLSLSSAITLGAIASATAPAATLMVVRQYKADGPLTKLLLLVVAIDDAVGLLLFSVSFGIATAVENGAASIIGMVLEPVLEIVLSLGMGAIIGWLLHKVELFFHSRSKRMAISVAFVLLAVGLSTIKFSFGGIHFGFSLLLICMMTGTVFCNICDTSEELMNRVESWTTPINILFFVISGAELDLNILVHPATLIIGVIYILSRCAGKYGASYLTCKMVKCSKTITQNLGITLFPQAGVALGMALTAANLSDGAIVRNVVLFSVLVYELVGPTLTKQSLLRAGEINPEGKTSARSLNQPKPPMDIH